MIVEITNGSINNQSDFNNIRIRNGYFYEKFYETIKNWLETKGYLTKSEAIQIARDISNLN